VSKKQQDLADQYAFRDSLVEQLERDLVGPGDGADEVIDELPLDRYVAGVLWPADDVVQETPEPDGAEADDSGAEDSPIAQALMRYPSSMGMTFTVDLAKKSTVSIEIAAARYVPSVDPDEDAAPTRPSWRQRKVRPKSWMRTPLVKEPFQWDVSKAGTSTTEVTPGLQLFVYVREPRNNSATVSVALRNTQTTLKDELRDAFAWFQVGIVVATDVPAIVDRSSHGVLGSDSDLDSAALLYRNTREFAIGHGCATTWTPSVEPRVSEVCTTFIPRQEVPRAKPGELGEQINLRMSFLANAGAKEIGASLSDMVLEYRAWIKRLADDVDNGSADVPPSLRHVVGDHLKRARTAADRIQAGIDLISSNREVARAFRLANCAMQAQRARQDWVRDGTSGVVGDGVDQAWYPFQIAYILLNLPGLADADHEDRNVADLLWFPTGGGKTEAYLGLVAFTILLRRIRDRDAAGTAVIMRYTLRLLTIQQFERATMLLCSLERVRQTEGDLGSRPFSIGLWVGRGATPNTLAEARKSLRDIASGKELTEKNPIQLTQCPWCGSDLDESNYSIVRPPEERLRIACGTPSCDFTDGLPAYVVDEDVYRARPELVLGTVDKFAMMAWNENVRKLFARDGFGTPPALIIQDELHLISGPLGSMVGLYETAIDAACGVQVKANGVAIGRPKVIASTATIRRATTQISAVFNRKAEQFPPPGIDPDRSFFAEPAPREDYGTREYVGVMASATSHATLLVRTYAAILQAAADIDGSDATRDPYWTLLGYFNSLRVLGSANLQVEGDVRDRLELVARREGTKPRKLRPPTELTSRVPSAEIPRTLKGLERSVSSGSADDVVLATNMISVGVDIDRLGLMTVMGQPQSSAEYIQATSRVGRKYPGLVVTIFNSARSRDRSHYENFIPYHQALYRAVEATSATPFAARARDRGLHGVLVSLARLLFDDLSYDGAAYLAADRYDELTEAVNLLIKRVGDVADEEADDTIKQLQDLVDVWTAEAAGKPNMRYHNSRNREAALLIEPEAAMTDENVEYSQQHAPWPTLQSMRDVDAESGLYQIPAMRRAAN
jgi:hypothetical protein